LSLAGLFETVEGAGRLNDVVNGLLAYNKVIDEVGERWKRIGGVAVDVHTFPVS
jgi:hypothetical protein